MPLEVLVDALHYSSSHKRFSNLTGRSSKQGLSGSIIKLPTWAFLRSLNELRLKPNCQQKPTCRPFKIQHAPLDVMDVRMGTP